MNDGSRGSTYNVNNHIQFKTTMLKSSSCDYSDAYILVQGNITVNSTAAGVPAANEANKKVILTNCPPFTNCSFEMNNTQLDNAKGIDIVMLMYGFKEYCDIYSEASGTLWQYCKGYTSCKL